MGFFIAVGIISLVVGLLFIIAPGTLRDINERTSRLVSNVEDTIFAYRVGVGLSLIIASLLFFFVAYYMRLKGFYFR